MKMIISFFISFQIYAAGFESDHYVVDSIEGRVRVQCSDGYNYDRTYSCYDQVTTPSAYSYFMSEREAESVVITARYQDGEEKTKRYKMKGNKTKKQVNLLVSSLLQRPLLRMGLNQLTYELTVNNLVVERGAFDVTVEAGQTRTCRQGHIYGGGHCHSSSSACSIYFSRHNNCH